VTLEFGPLGYGEGMAENGIHSGGDKVLT
jgi:hypothetical protein